MSIDDRTIGTLLAHATSAPSAHNTQPWIPEIRSWTSTRAEVVVAVDPARTLPHGDPMSEDLHLAMGCWTESLSIASAEAGVSAAVSAVRGRGPALEITITLTEDPAGVEHADATAASAGPTDVGRWPAASTTDLHHRQVDRGTLARDDAAFEQALAVCSSPLQDSNARLVEIPDGLWRRWQNRASLYSFSRASIVAETLDWLRFDNSDPRYRRDGLNADCLRISPGLARLAGRLNTVRLRPLLAAASAGTLAPASLLANLLPARMSAGGAAGRSARRTSAGSSHRTGAAAPPHHVVLVLDEAAESSHSSTTQSRVEREISAGRALLRTWLVLDRHGLRVDVHSEIKDCPATNSALRSHLGAASVPVRPIAAFSVGRSTGTVPRSHRLPV